MAIHGRPTSNKSPYGNLAGILSEAVRSSSYYEDVQNDKIKAEKLKGMQSENAQIKEQMGIDLSGISDPKIREKIIGEQLKFEGKKKLKEQEFEELEKLFGEKKGKEKPSKMKEEPEIPEMGKEEIEEEPLEEMEKEESRPKKLSDRDILRAEQIKPGLGKILQSQKESEKKLEAKKTEGERKSFESDREFHSKTSQPIIQKAMDTVREAPIKKGLMDQQRRDIESGNTEGIGPFLTEMTGLEFYRTPEEARYKAAVKHRFLENVSSMGGGVRPNQFLERILSSAQTTLGRDKESDLSVLDMEEFIDDMKTQRAKFEIEEAKKDKEKLGYSKNDISERADEKMEKWAEQRQDEMAYDIRNRHEENLDDTQLLDEIIGNKVGSDTPLTKRMVRLLMIKNNDDIDKAEAEAKSLGFRIPTPQTYKRH